MSSRRGDALDGSWLGESRAYRAAFDRAARLLAHRPRSVSELRDRLLGSGTAPADVAAVIARLEELGILDDGSFARRWIEERSGARSSSVLSRELLAKGVDEDVVTAVLEEAGPDDTETARNLAARHLCKVAAAPRGRQAARLQVMLLRRGYGHEVVEAAVRAVLPPEGWD